MGRDVACMRDKRNDVTFWLKNLQRRDHSKDLNINGRIILEWILGK
jgi:hypothetical protein